MSFVLFLFNQLAVAGFACGIVICRIIASDDLRVKLAATPTEKRNAERNGYWCMLWFTVVFIVSLMRFKP
jgi:hypothetical protein